jgi:Uma2 family endonuclease
MTFAEAARLDVDRTPGDLEYGEWKPVTKNTWRHGEIALSVAMLLKLYARANPGWSVAVGDPGTKLAHDPDLLRGPDVAIIRADRRPTGRGVDGWLDGAPDVAVEVIGDAQTATDLAKKALEYLAAGARAVWVLDDDRKCVMVFTPPDHVRILGEGEQLDGGPALPGFVCSVSELFE